MELSGQVSFAHSERGEMRSRVAAVACALVIVATAALAQTLSFDLVDNRVFVDVSINGKGPYKFILDTGAIAVVSEALARDLKFKIDAGDEGSGVGEKTVRSGRTHVRELRLGNVTRRDLDVGVLSLDDAPAVFGSKPVDGIIGLPVFERAVVTFDYVRHEVTLTRPEKFIASKDSTIVPFQRRGHIPIIDGELDGIQARFAIDTGARSALLVYAPFADKNKLREQYHATIEGITGWGIGGPVRSLLARAQSFKLGSVEVRDIVIRLSTQRGGATTASDLGGLIGPDILKQFSVTFDYPHSRMFLSKNSNYGRRDTWDRTGMWMAADTVNANEWRVLDVMPNSPAAQAGLRVDDRITQLDDKPVSHLVLPDVRDSLRTRPVGSMVRIEYRRGNQTHTTDVRLRDIV
jgi:predicted aspartyl protease